MSCNNQFALARMNDQVVDGDRGQMVLLMPGGAGVERDEQSKLGPHVKQVGVARIFANDVDRSIGGEVSRQRLPGLAEINALVKVGLSIIVAMPVHAQVD